jgi:hypothetical protein
VSKKPGNVNAKLADLAGEADRGDVVQDKNRKGPMRVSNDEPSSQFTLKMRKTLHKELAQLALDADMTMRGFVMNALKEKGLSVTEDDLIDRRKR